MKNDKLFLILSWVIAAVVVLAVFAAAYFAIYVLSIAVCIIGDKAPTEGLKLVSFFVALGVTICVAFSYYTKNL